MKKSSRNLIKIKSKDLKTKLYAGSRSKFIPAKDYRINIALLHRCRYCKTFKFSKEMSIYDGKLIYVCPECGGRHKYSTGKINFHKALQIICLLFVALCLFVIMASAQGVSISDIFDSDSFSQKFDDYEKIEVKNNSFNLDGETYKEYLFVVPEDGYYKFNSLSNCNPEDVNGKLIIDGEVVCENDNFAETESFYMMKYLKKDQNVILAVDAHEESMTKFSVQVKELSEKYASGIEIYMNASEYGYEVSSSKDVYFDSSFDSDSTNYTESATRKAKTFFIEEDESYIWLAFVATNSNDEEFYVWLPIKLD